MYYIKKEIHNSAQSREVESHVKLCEALGPKQPKKTETLSSCRESHSVKLRCLKALESTFRYCGISLSETHPMQHMQGHFYFTVTPVIPAFGSVT